MHGSVLKMNFWIHIGDADPNPRDNRPPPTEHSTSSRVAGGYNTYYGSGSDLKITDPDLLIQ